MFAAGDLQYSATASPLATPDEVIDREDLLCVPPVEAGAWVPSRLVLL